jgi:hypothetical protein
MIELDAVLSNADWAKRTPDRLDDLKDVESQGGGDKSQDEPAAKQPDAKPGRRKRGS